jgi:hypothetical protein
LVVISDDCTSPSRKLAKALPLAPVASRLPLARKAAVAPRLKL